MAQAPIQFDRASGVLAGANAWERLAAVALTLGSKVGANFSHRGYNMCANLLRTTLASAVGTLKNSGGPAVALHQLS